MESSDRLCTQPDRFVDGHFYLYIPNIWIARSTRKYKRKSKSTKRSALDQRHDVLLKFLVAGLEVVVNDDAVVCARVGVRQLGDALLQPCLNGLLVLAPAAAQPALELLDRRWLEKDILGVKVRLLDLLDAFHLDVEDAHAPLLGQLLDGGHGGAVRAPGKRCVLDEAIGVDQRLKDLGRHEVVFFSVRLAFARTASCVYAPGAIRRVRAAEGEGGGGGGDGGRRETENPKVSGYVSKSRASRVDLPVPDGPEMTITGRVVTAVDISLALPHNEDSGGSGGGGGGVRRSISRREKVENNALGAIAVLRVLGMTEGEGWL